MPNAQFMPDEPMTRAMVATIISRILWGDTFDGGNPRYLQHLKAMNNAGLVGSISSPSPDSLELRGWMMTMMKRSEDADIPMQ